MATEKELLEAKNVYETICSALDQMGWEYERRVDDFMISTGMNGNNTNHALLFVVEPEKNLVYLLNLCVDAKLEKCVDFAVAISVVNDALISGYFKYNFASNNLFFKIVNSYQDSYLSPMLFRQMIDISTSTVEHYINKLNALNNGEISTSDFAAWCYGGEN